MSQIYQKQILQSIYYKLYKRRNYRIFLTGYNSRLLAETKQNLLFNHHLSEIYHLNDYEIQHSAWFPLAIHY